MRGVKLFGLGAALVALALAGGNQGKVGLAQADCTVTLSPGQSIQDAIDKASSGATLCLREGTWEENLRITKSLTLRGAGREQTKIRGTKNPGYPVIVIESDLEIEVKIEGLTISEAERFSQEKKCAVEDPQWLCPDGISLRGKVKLTLANSAVSDNWGEGLLSVWGSAQVILQNSTISNNKGDGLGVGGSAQVILQNSTISNNDSNGLWVGDSAQVTLQNSTVSNNWGSGLYVVGSAQVTLQNSTVSRNQWSGLHVGDSARAWVITNAFLYNGGFGIGAEKADNIVECWGNRFEGNAWGPYSEAAAQKCG